MSDANILRELKKISKILLFSNAGTVEKELSRVATTDDRKKMWVLIDGKRTSKDIADAIGVTVRGVRYFLNAALDADMIEYERGESPRRVLDYVPPKWIDLITIESDKKERDEEAERSQATLNTLDTPENSEEKGRQKVDG